MPSAEIREQSWYRDYVFNLEQALTDLLVTLSGITNVADPRFVAMREVVIGRCRPSYSVSEVGHA